MKKAWIIAVKDYKSYFATPVAYIIAGLFSFIMSFMFYQVLLVFAQRSMMMMMQGGKGASLNDYVFGPHFGNVNVILLIMIPALTMRLFAEEKRNRTMDLLMTSPLTAGEIVFGKFLAGTMVIWTILSFMAVFPIVISFYSTFDKGPIISAFVGLALLSSAYVAIGVFASSLTENVIIAYFLAFIISMFFWVIGWAAMSMEGAEWQAVFNHLSIVNHYGNFIKGTIGTAGIVYYLSLIGFFCFLTHRVVESARWR